LCGGVERIGTRRSGCQKQRLERKRRKDGILYCGLVRGLHRIIESGYQ